MNAQEMSRVYGYIRASTDRQIASPETQREIIEEYAKRIGRSVDRFFIDPPTSGKKRLHDRDAGRELMTTLRSRDTVIVARLDRLSRSFIGFAQILDSWTKLKVVIHLCDMPGGHFDPDNPMSEMMIGILIVFANYERKLISQRTREGLQARKQRGEKYTRWAGKSPPQPAARPHVLGHGQTCRHRSRSLAVRSSRRTSRCRTWTTAATSIPTRSAPRPRCRAGSRVSSTGRPRRPVSILRSSRRPRRLKAIQPAPLPPRSSARP
jgi:DNA invertase Pin-like site-specific DNA recombinase